MINPLSASGQSANVRSSTSSFVCYEYLIIISPPESVKKKISLLKNELDRAIGIGPANLHAKAHITLAYGISDSGLPENILERIKRHVESSPAFSIKLNGFRHFVHGAESNTIYVALENSGPVVDLHRKINSCLSSGKRRTVPHLTIARKIARQYFDRAQEVFKNRVLEEEFACDHIVVLERPIQDGHNGRFEERAKINLGEAVWSLFP